MFKGNREDAERAAEVRSFIYDNHPDTQNKNIKKEGGSTEPEYMYLELDDDAIQQYRDRWMGS